MNYKTDEVEIVNRLNQWNIDLPNDVVFFPENLQLAEQKGDFIFSDAVADLSKVFKQNGIKAITLGGDPKIFRSRKYADWFGPALCFSLTLVTENPTIISVSLNVLSNYVTDFFKGINGEKRARLEIYLETKGKKKYKRITYNGPPEGIKDLEKVIKSLE
jgi:hypothetical protein